MKEITSWKMDSFHDLQGIGTRRPQTAVWKVPKSDTRREKYCKSAREHQTQSPRFSCSPSSSYESTSSSQVIHLHTSNGAYKLSNSSLNTDRRLPQIHNSSDLSKSNISTNSSSVNLHYSGSQNNETYLTSVDIKIPWYISVLNEKEHCLLKLGEEINRLARYEVESKRKDQMICALRNEISQLHCTLQQSSHLPIRTAQDGVTLQQSDHVSPYPENEMAASEEQPTLVDRKEETLDSPSSNNDTPPRHISSTSLPMSFSETQRESPVESESLNRDIAVEDPIEDLSAELENKECAGGFGDQFEDINKVILKLQADIEKTKGDYEMSKGVISSLQKVVSFHESKLRKSESEKEVLQRELRERELQIQAMSNKFSSMREEWKHGELMAVMEKENYNLRELVSELKSEVARRTDMIADFKTEAHRVQKEMADYQTQRREYEGEKKQLKGRIEDLVSAEQHVRVMLEAVQSKFERFRSKIIQAAYTAPGFKSPHVEVSDTEILNTMQKIIADRSDFHQQLKQKGVNVPPLYMSESSTSLKQTSSTTRRKAL